MAILHFGRLDELLVEKMSQDHFSVKQQSKCRRVLVGGGGEVADTKMPESGRKIIVNLVVSKIFLEFSPRKLGEDSHFDDQIFQMGWFNHQLVVKEKKYSFQIRCHKHIRLGNGRYGASW